MISVYFVLQHEDHSHVQVYLFRTFEQASYFLEKSQRVLGDQRGYDSEQGKMGEIHIPDVRARIVLVLDQDGSDLISKGSSSIALGNGVDD